MLIATPYRDFDCGRAPKIVSMVRKSFLHSAATNLRPRISGDLPVRCGTDKTWCTRRVQVRAGQLLVSEPASLRMPLRHLSLQAGPSPHSLAICRGQNVLLTLQTHNAQAFVQWVKSLGVTHNAQAFDQWVKTIAVELIRQTPVDAIKYLDILTLGESAQAGCEAYYDEEEAVEEVVETLMKKCQNVETYVPVKEKLCLFESLCKMGRKVRSSEDVSSKPRRAETKRAKSCHDLSNISRQIAVREICKYFEKCSGG